MLTPTQQIAAIFSGLSDDQQIDAVGRYSSVTTSTADDLAHVTSYFDPNVTSFMRKIILVSHSCAAILYYKEKQFKILSAPSMTTGPNNAFFFVSHEGDVLSHLCPVSISADKAVLDILVLATKPTNGISPLEDLMARPKVGDILIIEEEETESKFPFPEGEGSFLTASDENLFVKKLSKIEES